jgi:tRNA A-37 threonylcarbamoyl transferase component Bud32
VSVPNQIGQYRILRKIGAGGMGMVFVGEHLLIHRRAAIKTLQPALSKQPELVERFFNEARALSAIGDPGIVQIFDFGYHVDGTAYIVMELLEGEGLADRLDRFGTLAIPSALRIARQMASSLAATHAKQIVHRDLKPENIFLVRDCEAQGGERTKILDFGICAVGGAPETDAPPGTMIGTPVYMAPEQCCGRSDGDPRSDIYGLGCVLFQMLTGKAPFERDSVREVIQAHIAEPPPPVSSMREDVPPCVDELVARCLAKAPEDRFASMAELGAEIERVLARLAAPELPELQDLPGYEDAPAAVSLSAGYRSAYDAGLAARVDWDEVATEAAPAAPRGSPAPVVRSSPAPAAHSPAPTASTASASMGGAPARYASLRKAALGLALLGGALVASLATRLTDGDGALARANAPDAASVAPVAPRRAPAAAAAHEVAPARIAPARAAAASLTASPAPAAASAPAAAPPRGSAGAAPAPRTATVDRSGVPARSAERARPGRKSSAPAASAPAPSTATPSSLTATAATLTATAAPPAAVATAPAPPHPEAPRPPAAPAAAPAQATSEDLYDTR